MFASVTNSCTESNLFTNIIKLRDAMREVSPVLSANMFMAHPDHFPRPMATLAAAIASGQLAAVAMVQSLAAPR